MGLRTDQGLFFETPDVADAVGVSDAHGVGGDDVCYECWSKALDVGDLGQGILPGFVEGGENCCVGFDCSVGELDPTNC
jgi:hypothetical protein